MKELELVTIQLRLEGIRHAISRARFTLLVSIIASIAILVTAWNAYISNDSYFATQRHWSEDQKSTKTIQEKSQEGIAESTIAKKEDVKTETPVSDYVQQQIVSEWIKNQVISIGLLGIRVSVGDLSVIGSLSLFIISIWLFSSIRRENRAIGTLINYADKFQDWNLKHMVYHGIAHYLVLIDFEAGDKPISNFGDSDGEEKYHVPLIRLMTKLLFLLPSIAIFLVMALDVWTLFRKVSPFRTSEGALWAQLQASEKYWLAGNVAFALSLFFLTTLYCLKMLKFTNATVTFLDIFRTKLLADWKPQNEIVTSRNVAQSPAEPA